MKFYILGTNKSNHVIKTSKPLFESYNLDEAINVFEKYINEIRKTKLFLIVDFEKTKKSKFKYLNIDNDYENTEGGTSVPFFIIGEWSLGLNNDMCIRSDRTQIVMRGFNREFTDNLAAFRYFYLCITKLIPCEFRLLYKQRFYKDGNLYFKLFNRKIAIVDKYSTPLSNTITHSANKFYIPRLNWEPIPLEKNNRDINDYFLEVKCSNE